MVAIFGVHNARQLEHFRPDTFLGRRRLIAADLLDAIDGKSSTQLRDAYFERFIDHRGAFKRTYRNRFAEFDGLIAQKWQAHGQADGPLSVLDVAVSDGSTALDFADVIDKLARGAFSLTATDLDAHYLVLREAAGSTRRVVVTTDGDIVQIIYPPFVFSQQRSVHSKIFPVNRAVRPVAQKFAEHLIGKWRTNPQSVDVQKIVVANPDFRRRLIEDPRLKFRSWNVLGPWVDGRFHVVRAMNIMNPGYFSLEEQQRVTRHWFEAMYDGGLLAVGSNGDAGSTVDGVIFQKQASKLIALQSTGAGVRCAEAFSAYVGR